MNRPKLILMSVFVFFILMVEFNYAIEIDSLPSDSVSGAMLDNVSGRNIINLTVESENLKSDWPNDDTLFINLPHVEENNLQYFQEEKIPMQVGIGREVTELNDDLKLKNLIIWRNHEDGGYVTTLVITSSDAKAMRAGIKITKIPQNIEFRFFPASTKNTTNKVEFVSSDQILNIIEKNFEAGEITQEGKIYWSPSVEGDSIGIEIYLPPNFTPNDVQISIPLISHINVSILELFDDQFITFWPGDALNCQNDVNCFAEWSNVKKTVAGMAFVKDGNSYTCTGTLLNDIDDKTWIPYFVTANHCISTQTVASTLETHWFHESVSCNSPYRSSSYQKVSGGAKLLSTVGWNTTSSLNGDATLLQLNSNPPSGSWFAGWTTARPSNGSVVTGIHHPRADLKKISFATYGYKQVCIPAAATSFYCYPSSSGFFVEVNYYDGTTELGSSGSALYNNNGQVVGILKGGSGTCYDLNPVGTYTEFALPYVLGNWKQWLFNKRNSMPWISLLLKGSDHYPPPPPPPPPVCPTILNGNFESGNTGWTEYSSHGWGIITDSAVVTPHSGSYVAWLGGDFDDVSYIMQSVTVSSSCPYLTFYHWIGSEDVCGYDDGYVRINGTSVSTFSLCGANNTGGWVVKSINLGAYAGQTVSLQFRAETDESLNSNWFIDDVSFRP